MEGFGSMMEICEFSRQLPGVPRGQESAMAGLVQSHVGGVYSAGDTSSAQAAEVVLDGMPESLAPVLWRVTSSVKTSRR